MKVYEHIMRAVQKSDHDWAESSMEQIPIHTWKRDDLPFIFESIKLISYAIEPDRLVYTIRFHDANRNYVAVWVVTPALIGGIRVKSHGAPERIADWITECLIDTLRSDTN